MAVLVDGWKTIFTIAGLTGHKFEEVDVTPPSVESGGKQSRTTQRNTAWRTAAAKGLKTLGDFKVTCKWDPAIYDQIIPIIGVNKEITVTLPDDSTLVFWAVLDKFTPGGLSPDGEPMADLEFYSTNLNGSNAETPPEWTVAP